MVHPIIVRVLGKPDILNQLGAGRLVHTRSRCSSFERKKKAEFFKVTLFLMKSVLKLHERLTQRSSNTLTHAVSDLGVISFQVQIQTGLLYLLGSIDGL
jgi:hypothetical protein